MSETYSGAVLFFDNEIGHGEVLSDSGEVFYFHYSAIKSGDAWKRLDKKDRVRFSLYRNLYMAQIDKVEKIDS